MMHAFRVLAFLSLAGLSFAFDEALFSSMLSSTGGLTAGLVDLIASMAKVTGSISTAHKGVLTQLQSKLTSEELPALAADLLKDQNLLSYHASVLSDCDLMMVRRNSTVKKLQVSSESLGAAAASCVKLRDSLLAQKYSGSEEFKAWITSQSPPGDQLPSLHCSDDLEMWIAAGSKFYEDYNKTYTEYKVNETKIDVEAKLSVANCSSENRLLNQSICAWRAEVDAVVVSYKGCRNDTTLLFGSTLQRVKASETSRQTKHTEMMRSYCQITALCLPDSGLTSGELAACDQAAAPNQSQYTLKVPVLAPYNIASVVALGGPSESIVCS